MSLTSRRHAAIVEAVRAFDRARDHFVDLTNQTAERWGDPEFDRALEDARREELDASWRLGRLIGNSFAKPIIINGRLYRASRQQSSILRVEVDLIDPAQAIP